MDSRLFRRDLATKPLLNLGGSKVKKIGASAIRNTRSPALRSRKEDPAVNKTRQPLSARGHRTSQGSQIVDELKAMFSLNLSRRNLLSFPVAITTLHSTITHLDLSCNQFVHFPEEVLSVTILKTLKLDHNFLKKLPDSIEKLTSLENLSVSHNHLHTLPTTMSKLKKTIKALDFSYNRIETLPKELMELPILSVLRINNNAFTAMPVSISSLVSLRELGLEWFKYTNPSMIVRQSSQLAIHKLFELSVNLR